MKSRARASPWNALFVLSVAFSAAGADDAALAPWWSPASLPSLKALGVESWSDVFHRGLWSGNLKTSYTAQRQQIRAPGSPEQESLTRLFAQSITIRNEGFSLVDPRLVSGNIGFSLAAQRNRQDAGAISVAQQGVLTDYNFDATLLGEKSFSIGLFANRSQTLTTQPSGGTTQFASEHRGVNLLLREDNLLREKEILPYFGGHFRARQEHNQEVTNVASNSFHRDDKRSVLDLAMHNGSEISDLDFHHEYADLANLIYAPGSYRSRMTSLTYSRDFGPTLNRRWDNRIYYQSRDGSAPVSSLSVDELLTLEHHANLASSYSYQYLQQTTPAGTVTANSGSLLVRHRLYANLTTTLGLTGMRQTFPNGRIDSRSGQLNFNYNRRLPWSGQLTASLGGSNQISSNQLQAGFVPVVDAPYEAPQQLGAGAGFLLKDLFIVAESLEVVAIKGGARVPTTAGIDYLVVAEGSRTRILLQPTSAIIQPGDSLQVSYAYRLDPSVKYQTTSRSASVGADWRWVGVSFSHDESAQKPVAGGDSSFLTSSRRDTVRLNLRGDWQRLQLSGDASATRHVDSRLAYDEHRMTQRLSYVPNDDLTISLNGSEYRVNYQSPQRQTTGWSGSLDVNWLAAGGWFVTSSVSRRVYKDTQVASERVDEASLKVNRKWTKLDLALVFSLAQRSRAGVQFMNANAHFSAVRRF